VLKLGLAFLTTVLALNAIAGSRGLPAVLQARRDFDRDEQALERLRAENAGLRQEIRRLREDPETVEEVARRELGYIRPGEKVFVVNDVGPADSPAPTPAPKPAGPEPGPAPAQ
jgi:cell division protein FtsB